MFDDEDKDEDEGDLFAAPTKPKTKEPEHVRDRPSVCYRCFFPNGQCPLVSRWVCWFWPSGCPYHACEKSEKIWSTLKI